MDLISQVVFSYNIYDHNTNTGESSSFCTITELQKAISNGKDYFTMPYQLDVKRVVQIFDKDMPKETDNKIIPVLNANIHPMIVETESVKMIVANKLMYPRDVRSILRKKYKDTLDFDTQKKWDKKEPVYFSGVTEDTHYGLRDSETGAPTQYTLRYVNCRPLNAKDIVVDENLNQIWSTKTGKIPDVLAELLSRTKENVRCQ